jgi:hypothetical protein
MKVHCNKQWEFEKADIDQEKDPVTWKNTSRGHISSGNLHWEM